MDGENLKSAGVLGLIEAAQKYDEQRGVSFETFSYPRIRGAIVDELRRNSPLSQRILKRISMVRSAMEALEPPVSPEMLARETGMSMDDIEECLEAMQLTRYQSWDSLNESGDRSEVGRTENPASRMEHEETLSSLADCIEKLPDRERLVLTLYHEKNLRLKEIGEVLNISESRVSRVLSKAQFRIREMFRVNES